MRTLAEQLGYQRTDRVLIINCDDLGMCHSANEAAFVSLLHGLATSATIMIPCPWAYDAIQRWHQHRNLAIGIHLTLTSEWETYRWRPIAPSWKVPGLIDPDGFMWRSITDVYTHATPEEVYLECKSQIEQGIDWGLDITHLDSHMGVMQIHPCYLQVYAQLAGEYRLPLRMASQNDYAAIGLPDIRNRVAETGIIFCDNLILPEHKYKDETMKEFVLRKLSELPFGISEFFIHASIMTPELQAIVDNWQMRCDEFCLFTADRDIQSKIIQERIFFTTYRLLRDHQRRKTEYWISRRCDRCES
ncbi:polysaccharide deacetylase family protein [Fodinisporobacter ferrooxydans]|uniref:Polysaccharide deacetylase family protein n=1 Tax=Fodinisporobacter ferrooxydans TaxID=2901836 RepID=A0ABY4CTJ8_9BACL|nr:polysaccharide deacetylase family protein [Alicyclobacillaceae bacterium MYW30-H2]